LINPLEHALAAVTGRCGGDAGQVERVDVDRQGRLHLQARTPAGVRWFTQDEQGCREVLPERDGALPLAGELPALGRTGHVEVLAWRPGRRIVLRLDRGGSRLVLKGYRARRSSEVAARHAVARAALDDGWLTVPELLDHDEARACLTFKFSAGQALPLGTMSQERFFRLGAALHAAQQHPPPANLPAHGPQEELAVIDQLGERVDRATGGRPAHWGELRARLEEIEAPAPPALVLAHRDLHDGQFVAAQDRLVLLDFDLLARADSLLDAANLLAHLKLRALQGVEGAGDEAMLTCGRALLEGLDGPNQPDVARRLRFYQATTFLRLLLVYRLRPRWSGVLPGLLVMAERCLDDLRR